MSVWDVAKKSPHLNLSVDGMGTLTGLTTSPFRRGAGTWTGIDVSSSCRVAVFAMLMRSRSDRLGVGERSATAQRKPISDQFGLSVCS